MLIAVALLLLMVAGAAALGWWPATAASEAITVPVFDEATVERGAQLAAVGGCEGCHTEPGGMPYAGGVVLPTSFGIIHGTNITPDPETGIGRWDEAAFVRAMRKGIDRDGRNLYPAFPYDHFELMTDDELHALYAYMMTRTAVAKRTPPNQLKFPYNLRPLLSAWKALYLRDQPFAADTKQSPEWNRGAYLVQSLGHCGACHTPRNALGAERRDAALAGGEADGWYAPPLNAASPSPLPWTVEQMTTYLREGVADQHAIAGGPMQPVVYRLARARLEDVRAIAIYIVALMGGSTPEREQRSRASLAKAGLPGSATPSTGASGGGGTTTGTLHTNETDTLRTGAAIYLGACASCHEEGRQLSSAGALQLPLAIAVHESTPLSLIRIIDEGITPPEGERHRWMPAFAGALTEEQLSALLTYLRTFATNAPPWSDIAGQVRQSRHS